MALVKITNGTVDQYPYTVGNLRRDNPQTSFPRKIPSELLASYDVYEVTQEEPPQFDSRTQTIVRAEKPVLSDGLWVLGWIVASKTAEEIASYDKAVADANRKVRNDLLSSSDWTQVADSPLSDSQQSLWATYRQALRDITSHANWPHLDASDWPTQP